MDTATATRFEVSVDTELAACYDVLFEIGARIAAAEESIHFFADSTKRPKSRGRGYIWITPIEQAIDTLTAGIADGTVKPWNARPAQNAIGKRETAIAEGEQVTAVVNELNEIFQISGGWTRFFLVPGGHIHSSRSCHSCYPTTRFSWLPTLSGLTEADAVAEHGTILCSHCFPSAPVEWTASKHGENAKPEGYYCEGSGQSPTYEEYTSVDRQGNERKDHRPLCPGCQKRLTPYGYRGAEVTTSGKVRKHKSK